MSQTIIMPQDRLAFDRTATTRRLDQDGRLHISSAPISKATVNPYYGREIPGSERHGLEPGRVYQLLRHPEELEKGAPSFHNVPLLNIHQPHSAQAHDGTSVVGSVSNPGWKLPYLLAELVVWDADSILGIESGVQKELSSSYRYDYDPSPGEYQGVAFDGIMRNIQANHVALVEQGRAGSDVVVGDAALSGSQGPVYAGKFASQRGVFVPTWRNRFALDAEQRDNSGKFASGGGGESGGVGKATSTHRQMAAAHGVASAEHFAKTGSKNAGFAQRSKAASAAHDVARGAHQEAAKAHADNAPNKDEASSKANAASEKAFAASKSAPSRHT